MSQCRQYKLSQYEEARGAIDPQSVSGAVTEVLHPVIMKI